MYVKRKRDRISNTILEKKNVGLTLPDFNIYYKDMIVKTLEYWWTNKLIHKWNKIKSPVIKLYTYSQLVFDKGTKAWLRRKNRFSASGAGTSGHPQTNNKNRI